MADNLTSKQRSYTMSRIRSTDTSPELIIRRLLHARGLRFRKHKSDLPGKPDLVFCAARVVVFIDGDFWHGWRFQKWGHKLAPYWKTKIEGNRTRDQRNFRRLRRAGWEVIRVWEHQVKNDPESLIEHIEAVVRRANRRQPVTTQNRR